MRPPPAGCRTTCTGDCCAWPGGRWLARSPTGFDEEDVALSAFHTFCRSIMDGRYGEVANRDALWQLLLVVTINKARRRIRDENRLCRGGGFTQNDISGGLLEAFASPDQTGDGVDGAGGVPAAAQLVDGPRPPGGRAAQGRGLHERSSRRELGVHAEVGPAKARADPRPVGGGDRMTERETTEPSPRWEQRFATEALCSEFEDGWPDDPQRDTRIEEFLGAGGGGVAARAGRGAGRRRVRTEGGCGQPIDREAYRERFPSWKDAVDRASTGGTGLRSVGNPRRRSTPRTPRRLAGSSTRSAGAGWAWSTRRSRRASTAAWRSRTRPPRLARPRRTGGPSVRRHPRSSAWSP